EPRDRRAAVCVAPHDRLAPVSHLSQARHHGAHAAAERAAHSQSRLNISRSTDARGFSAAALSGMDSTFQSRRSPMSKKPNVVLVHGAWADGSSWSAVIDAIQANGFTVSAPQFPETSLAADVARLRQVLRRQDGPTVVVGHSYGGQIITALGSEAPNVVGLVYIAAFGLDEGETLGALLSQGPVTPALAHLFTDSRGFGWLSEDDFVNHFAADVDPKRARVLYAVQQALASSAFT